MESFLAKFKRKSDDQKEKEKEKEKEIQQKSSPLLSNDRELDNIGLPISPNHLPNSPALSPTVSPSPQSRPALPATPPVRSSSGPSASGSVQPSPQNGGGVNHTFPFSNSSASSSPLTAQRTSIPSSNGTSSIATQHVYSSPASSSPVIPPASQTIPNGILPYVPSMSASMPAALPSSLSLNASASQSLNQNVVEPKSNDPFLDNLCRTALSSDIYDQQFAARHFLEQTSTLDERRQSDIAVKAIPVLGRLVDSSNATVQTHSIQTIALLARNKAHHSAMIAHSYLQKLLDQLNTSHDARVVEACLAALTHLAKSPQACDVICQQGFPSLLPLLDARQSFSIGVQCNALALIGTLAAHEALIETMIRQDVLQRLFSLRDTHLQPDIRLNAKFCLKEMGYSEEDPSPTHIAMIREALVMGFQRGPAELAIRQVKNQRGHQLTMEDMQAVSTFLLDNIGDVEPSPPLRSASPLSHSHSRVFDDSNRGALYDSQSSARLDDAKQLEAQMRRDKITGLKRVAQERESEVKQLLDLGFSRKDAIFSLYYQQNLNSAVEWIVRRGQFLSARAARQPDRSHSGSRRDDDDVSNSLAMERTESNEHGYDSEGIQISEFDGDRSSSLARSPSIDSDLKRFDDDDGWEQISASEFPSSHTPQRSSSLPSANVPVVEAPRSDMPRQFSQPLEDRHAMLEWLAANNFSDYIKNFSDQQITLDTLAILTDHDLKDLGMEKLGDRRRFMVAANTLNPKQPTHSRSISQPHSPAPPTSRRPGVAPSLEPTAEELGDRSASGPIRRPQSPLSEPRSHNGAEDGEECEEYQSPTAAVLNHQPVHPGRLNRSAVHFAFLQSMPLRHSEVPGISKKLDLTKEAGELQNALNESGKRFRVCWEIATKDNLLKMMTYSRALHISGHGDPHALVLEDGKGDVAPLPIDKLQQILKIGGTQLKFVFVSACFSSRAAYAFAVAGVPHVIAVQEDTRVTDTSARAFAHHVYLALCQGLTVAAAFQKGQAAVIAASSYNPPCCCAHLHNVTCATCQVCGMPVCCSVHAAPCHTSQVKPVCCHPSIPHDESLKFLLLPAGANHDVPLFLDEHIEDGHWINKSSIKPPNNLPSGPDDFLGRAKDGIIIVPQILRHRLCLIIGPRGVGKSALARNVATYINDRRHFSATYLIKLQDCRTIEAVEHAVARVLKLPVEELVARGAGSVHEAIVQHLKQTKDNKPFLFVFDDCDLIRGDPMLIDAVPNEGDVLPSPLDSSNKRAFRLFIAALLEDTPSHILLTSDRSPGMIDGHTSRVYKLAGLHPLDLVALFVNRLPRTLRPDDVKQYLPRVDNLQHLQCHPLFSLMNGLPRMAEWCAELLNFTKMDLLCSYLCQKPEFVQPASGGPSFVRDSPTWPNSLPQEARALLRKCQVLMKQSGFDWDQLALQRSAALASKPARLPVSLTGAPVLGGVSVVSAFSSPPSVANPSVSSTSPTFDHPLNVISPRSLGTSMPLNAPSVSASPSPSPSSTILPPIRPSPTSSSGFVPLEASSVSFD